MLPTTPFASFLRTLLYVGAALQILIPLSVITIRTKAPQRTPNRELSRRIQRVLKHTVSGSSVAFVLLLCLSALQPEASRFGLLLVAFTVGQLALLVRRWLSPRALVSARLDGEILYLLFATALLTMTHAEAVSATTLGRGFSLILAAMFLSRSLIQTCYYRAVWPAGFASRVGSWGLALGFLSISLAYALNTAAPHLSPSSMGEVSHVAHE
jgi:hypothetical protein